jgi:hypothetical protein
MGCRHLDDQCVLERRDAMHRSRPVAERVPGGDLDLLEGATDHPELERRPALADEPRLVLNSWYWRLSECPAATKRSFPT